MLLLLPRQRTRPESQKNRAERLVCLTNVDDKGVIQGGDRNPFVLVVDLEARRFIGVKQRDEAPISVRS